MKKIVYAIVAFVMIAMSGTAHADVLNLGGNYSQIALIERLVQSGHAYEVNGNVYFSVASVLQMENGYIHPNLNLDNPIDSECRLNGLKSVEADINIAMNNSFGFGGINSSIIIRKGHKNGSRN